MVRVQLVGSQIHFEGEGVMSRFEKFMMCLALSYLFACVGEVQPPGSFSAYYAIGGSFGWMLYGVLQFFREFGR